MGLGDGEDVEESQLMDVGRRKNRSGPASIAGRRLLAERCTRTYLEDALKRRGWGRGERKSMETNG